MKDENNLGSATAGAAAMSKAEAAQWCRENGLNVPAEWERAAEVSPPDALSPVAQDGAMPKQSVTPWTVRMGVSVDDMVCPQEAWHHLKAEILGWRALFAARLAADVSPPDGAMPEPLGYITKESMRHLQEGGGVMAAIHPEVEPGATDFQPIYAAQPAEGSAQVAMPCRSPLSRPNWSSVSCRNWNRSGTTLGGQQHDPRN